MEVTVHGCSRKQHVTKHYIRRDLKIKAKCVLAMTKMGIIGEKLSLYSGRLFQVSMHF